MQGENQNRQRNAQALENQVHGSVLESVEVAGAVLLELGPELTSTVDAVAELASDATSVAALATGRNKPAADADGVTPASELEDLGAVEECVRGGDGCGGHRFIIAHAGYIVTYVEYHETFMTT